MSKAPRYRLVGYDIGTAPDENGGWVHWTDHEAIVARLTAERDAALAAKSPHPYDDGLTPTITLLIGLPRR